MFYESLGEAIVGVNLFNVESELSNYIAGVIRVNRVSISNFLNLYGDVRYQYEYLNSSRDPKLKGDAINYGYPKVDKYRLFNPLGYKSEVKVYRYIKNVGTTNDYWVMDAEIKYVNPADYFHTLNVTSDYFDYMKLLKLWPAAGLFIADEEPKYTVPLYKYDNSNELSSLRMPVSSEGILYDGYSKTANTLYRDAIIKIRPLIVANLWKEKDLQVPGGIRDNETAERLHSYATTKLLDVKTAIKESIRITALLGSQYRYIDGSIPKLTMTVPILNMKKEQIGEISGTAEEVLSAMIDNAIDIYYEMLLDKLSLSVLETSEQSGFTRDYSKIDPWTDPFMVYDADASLKKGYAVFIDRSTNQSVDFMNLPIEAKSIEVPTLKAYTPAQIQGVRERFVRTGAYSQYDLEQGGYTQEEGNKTLLIAALAAAGLYIYSQVR